MFSKLSASPAIGNFKVDDPINIINNQHMEETLGQNLEFGVPIINFFNPRNVTYIDPPYTVYPFEVEYQSLNLRWRAKKRFSEFAKLQKKLESEYPNIELPPLPSKTWRRCTDTEFINERKDLLAQWMQLLL